jgi:eukaryotic-like serine/threonine-protein kinase
MSKDEPTAQAVPQPQHTVVMPTRSVPPTSFGGDSYQPPSVLGTMLGGGPTSSVPQSQREQIVPGSASSASILAEVRKGPSDRLHIEARAAAGGMGSIDIAVDRALDRRIAVKTLHPHLRSDDAAVRMFLREARLTGLLDHPHIVPVYDVGERDLDSLYFSMKLVEGQTLSALVRALPRGLLDSTVLYSLLDIVTKVCDALAFAHSRGVIHCDVKSSNVMVGEFGQVYLMDWGIARLVASEVAPGSVPDFTKAGSVRPSATDNSVIGTPCYMSPEQARGDRGKLDARSDVFLLGALLYEILTRRPPYNAQDRNETLALAASGVFPSPRKIAGEVAVPPELDRIVMRAMAKKPEDRYPSVSALREDLVRFMRGGAEFPRQTFAAGSFILREGEEGDAAYIIVSGKCEIQKELPSGPEILQTVGPGAVFGEMAILDAGPRTASVVAVEDTDVLVVTSAVLEQEMAALKPWMATLMKSLAARFRNIDAAHRATYVGSSSQSISPARLANQILMHVTTWGDEGPNGSRSTSWKTLARELEAQLGAPPMAIFGVTTRYGLVLDLEKDTLTVPDPQAFAARLKTDLAREG